MTTMSRVQNPSAGTILNVTAGERVQTSFDFFNEAPDPQAFHLEVGGLPNEWTFGVGPQARQMAAASGGGALRLQLAPPLHAQPGDYPLQARVICAGSVVQETALILRVSPGAASTSTTSNAATPPDFHPGVAAVVPPTIAPPANANGHPPSPQARDSQTPISPPVISPPVVAPPSTPPTVAPQPITPTPTPTPTPRQDEALPIVDLRGPGTPPPSDVEAAPPPSEASVLDARDGAVLSVRPGETLLLRFGFFNDGARERTFVTDEDRSLPSEWISLVQEAVNISPGGSGEVSVRLTPPLGAEPGEYPFAVRIGPLGGVLAPRNLILSVVALPAVRLKAKSEMVKTGPFSGAADFALSVESIGNADTAFRVSVKDLDAPDDAATPDGSVPDIYETPHWSYNFDREMATLQSPAQNRAPQPEPIRLRVQRKGAWWLGWRETHRLRVSAVPVTDANNGGKPGNSLDLTLSHWRLHPTPLVLLLPLLFFGTLLMSRGAGEVSITNAQYQDADGRYWIVRPAGTKKDVALQWSAFRLAPLRLNVKRDRTFVANPLRLGSGSYHDQISVSSADRRADYSFNVRPMLGLSAGTDALASFVFTRGDTPLEVSDARGARQSGADVTVSVPQQGVAALKLRNMARQKFRLDWWMVKSLDADSPFRFQYIKRVGSLEPFGRDTESLLFTRNPAGTGDTDTVVLVNTDANRPVLTVHLQAAP